MLEGICEFVTQVLFIFDHGDKKEEEYEQTRD